MAEDTGNYVFAPGAPQNPAQNSPVGQIQDTGDYVVAPGVPPGQGNPTNSVTDIAKYQADRAVSGAMAIPNLAETAATGLGMAHRALNPETAERLSKDPERYKAVYGSYPNQPPKEPIQDRYHINLSNPDYKPGKFEEMAGDMIEGGVGGATFGGVVPAIGGVIGGAAKGASKFVTDNPIVHIIADIGGNILGSKGAGLAKNLADPKLAGSLSPAVQAAIQENIDHGLVALASGKDGYMTKLQWGARNLPVAGGITGKAANKVNDSFHEVLNERLGQTGNINNIDQVSKTSGGNSAREGFNRYLTGVHDTADAYYNALETVAPRASVIEPFRFQKILEEVSQEVSGGEAVAAAFGSPASDALNKLKSLYKTYVDNIQNPANQVIGPNNVSWDALKQIKQTIGAELKDVGTFTSGKDTIYKRAFGALAEDLKDAFVNPADRELYERTNLFYKTSLDAFSKTVKNLNDAGVTSKGIYQAIDTSMRTGDSEKLASFKNVVSKYSPELWGDYVSSALKEFGRDATGNFDIAAWGRNYSKFIETRPEIARSLFANTPFAALEQSYGRLATVATQMNTVNKLQNSSNTAPIIHAMTILASLGAGATNVVMHNPGTMGTEEESMSSVYNMGTDAHEQPGIMDRMRQGAYGAAGIGGAAAAALLMTSPRFVRLIATPISRKESGALISAVRGIGESGSDLNKAANMYADKYQQGATAIPEQLNTADQMTRSGLKQDFTSDGASYTEPQKGFAEGGAVEKGNINLYKRAATPVWNEEEGGNSTIWSQSSEDEDGNQVIYPRVSEDKRIMSPDEAENEYRKTGKHLGKFKTIPEAEAEADRLHVMQEDIGDDNKRIDMWSRKHQLPSSHWDRLAYSGGGLAKEVKDLQLSIAQPTVTKTLSKREISKGEAEPNER